MTLEMVKLATFFVSNMDERKEELAELLPVYVWAVGTRKFITEVLQCESEIPAEFNAFVDSLTTYCKDMSTILKGIGASSSLDAIPEDAICVLAREREHIVGNYKLMANAASSYSTICGGLLTPPDSEPVSMDNITNTLKEFMAATSSMR